MTSRKATPEEHSFFLQLKLTSFTPMLTPLGTPFVFHVSGLGSVFVVPVLSDPLEIRRGDFFHGFSGELAGWHFCFSKIGWSHNGHTSGNFSLYSLSISSIWLRNDLRWAAAVRCSLSKASKRARCRRRSFIANKPLPSISSGTSLVMVDNAP